MMNGAIAKDHDMRISPGSVRMPGAEVEAEPDFSRASSAFALANAAALLLAIVAAVLLHRSTTIPELSTPAAVCLGLTVGLAVTARLGLRKVLTDEARRKGLGPEQMQAFVRYHLGRYGERRRV